MEMVVCAADVESGLGVAFWWSIVGRAVQINEVRGRAESRVDEAVGGVEAWAVKSERC